MRRSSCSALGFGSFLAVSAWLVTFDPPYTTIGGTTSCTEDTCLCWLEEHHTWARFSCTPMPEGTCFKSLGTCP